MESARGVNLCGRCSRRSRPENRPLIWEYPRATQDGEQMDFMEVMDIENGLIKHHRVYWGWAGVEIIKADAYHK